MKTETVTKDIRYELDRWLHSPEDSILIIESRMPESGTVQACACTKQRKTSKIIALHIQENRISHVSDPTYPSRNPYLFAGFYHTERNIFYLPSPLLCELYGPSNALISARELIDSMQNTCHAILQKRLEQTRVSPTPSPVDPFNDPVWLMALNDTPPEFHSRIIAGITTLSENQYINLITSEPHFCQQLCDYLYARTPDLFHTDFDEWIHATSRYLSYKTTPRSRFLIQLYDELMDMKDLYDIQCINVTICHPNHPDEKFQGLMMINPLLDTGFQGIYCEDVFQKRKTKREFHEKTHSNTFAFEHITEISYRTQLIYKKDEQPA